MLKYLKFAFILFIFLSCNDDGEIIVPEAGYNYFPLQVNTYRDYKINSTKYFLRPDSTLNMVVPDSTVKAYFLREIIASKFLDFEGDSALRIEIFTKTLLQDAWPNQPDSIAIAKLKNDELIYEINNRTLIKLIFPVKNGISWNANKFNSLGEELYSIDNLGSSIQLEDTILSPALKVIQSDIDNLIEVDKRTEEYVLNVGLARKNTRILQYRQSNGMVLTGEIEKGTIFTQELIKNGKI